LERRGLEGGAVGKKCLKPEARSLNAKPEARRSLKPKARSQSQMKYSPPMLRRVLVSLSAFGTIALVSCSRPAGLFSTQNARAHVSMLAGTIGSRPVGTPANQRAREYIIDQLKLFGFEVRVQEADARRPELGQTTHVVNIIASLPGTRPEAIGLVAHYDSRPEAPGATDDALGVAVALEAARVFASRTDRRWSLFVLLTDGEEADLMGAAALMTDRDVTRRLAAYLQVESIGSNGPALLFETGPENQWLVGAWAQQAPHPRGASFALEIYKRLPSDTDFSIIKRQQIPGLNFAPVGDSYAYHTARDTPERLSPRTIRETGENIVALLNALDGMDITQRSTGSGTYFDIAGTRAIVYGPMTGQILSLAAILFGTIAWVRVTGAAIRMAGVLRWILTFVWTAAGTLLVFASMIGATWALRAAREVYHPWYAKPDRMFSLLLAVGVLVAWMVSRAWAWLPARAHGLRHPLVAWSVALPFWIALGTAAFLFAPSAVYLWTIPLLTAGVLLTFVRPTSGAAVRVVSLVVFDVVAALWLHEALVLLRFLVATLGRFPIVTPVFVYAAVVLLVGVMLAPPLLGAIAPTRRLLRPSLLTSLALIALTVTAALAYRAPAYTSEAPLRRTVRVLQTPEAPSVWEVGSIEPGLDLATGAPGGWERVSNAAPGGVPWGRLRTPFVFRTSAPAIGPAPLRVTQASLQPVAGGLELLISVVPREPGLTVSFVLPAGVIPARHNLPGLVRAGSWTATYIAVPPDGVLFRAAFNTADPSRVGIPLVLVSTPRIPGGDGWQSLPSWLPQERTVWSATATWALPMTFAAAAPLR
jgi:Peptidase family M28